jgi:hypothetical protein
MNDYYNIQLDENHKSKQRFIFEWYDINGIYHIVETTDMDEAETVLGLLSGNICLGDLED